MFYLPGRMMYFQVLKNEHAWEFNTPVLGQARCLCLMLFRLGPVWKTKSAMSHSENNDLLKTYLRSFLIPYLLCSTSSKLRNLSAKWEQTGWHVPTIYCMIKRMAYDQKWTWRAAVRLFCIVDMSHICMLCSHVKGQWFSKSYINIFMQ